MRDCAGIADAVRRAERRVEHVLDLEPGHEPREVLAAEPLDRHAELPLKLASLGEPAAPRLGRGQEEVADLVEEGWPELLEELDALPGEQHLGRGRELLANAAHRLSRRPGGDRVPLREHDVVRACEREVVGDARAHRPCSRDHDPHTATLSWAR